MLQAIAVAFGQLGQAGARQAAQLLLRTQLHGKHGAVLRLVGFDHGGLGRAFVVQQAGEGLVVILVRLGGKLGARCSLGCRGGVVQVFELLVVIFFRFRLRWRRRGQARVQLAGDVADLVLAVGGRGIGLRIAQPHPQLQQRQGDEAALAQAQGQRQHQQDGGKDAHALQADQHRLLELAHVQADAQLPGGHVLEGDLGLVQAFGLAQQAVARALAGFGEDAVVHAVDRRMGHQWVFHQVAEQHVEAEDVVGHQQLGGRCCSLGGQALAQGIGLLMHGLLELQAHHAGVDHQRQRHQENVGAGDAQCQRHATLTQGAIDHQEEIVWFDWRGPVHRARLLMA
ncbi:hypothetical protein D3C75_611230 [compost metagenome]